MNCPSCGQEVRIQYKVCPQCTTKLPDGGFALGLIAVAVILTVVALSITAVLQHEIYTITRLWGEALPPGTKITGPLVRMSTPI